MRSSLTVFALALLAAPLVAQDSVPPRVVAAPRDTLVHRPGPMSYFFRSFLIPGWGQASLDRKLTGGIFVGFEGLAIGMALKANAELHFVQETGDTALITSKKNERQDWYTLIVFNHLFAGLEAFVSAHLVDFPGDLKIRPIIGRRTGVQFMIGVPH